MLLQWIRSSDHRKSARRGFGHADDAQSGSNPFDGRPSARRHRSHECSLDTGFWQRRSGFARGVPADCSRVRRAHAVRFAIELQANRESSGPKGLSRAGGGLRGSIRTAGRLCARTSRNQIPHGRAGYGNMARANPRNPDRGAISDLASDSVGPGGPRGHTIRRSIKPSLDTRHRGVALSVFAVQHPPRPTLPHAGG